MKKYSIKDIAQLSGVSVATVSRVINNNGRFSEETRQKVLKVIEETGYNMNYSAKSLRMKKSFSIGILVPDISNYFFSDVVQKIEEILFDRGYSTIICNTARNQQKEIAYLQMLQAKGVDGLIVISGADAFTFEDNSTEKKIPYICIDREPVTKDQTIFIASNHYQGAFEATEELIQHGVKHPVIALASRESTSAKERFSGFKDALKKNNLVYTEQQHVIRLGTDTDRYQEILSSFLKNNPHTDGVFAINDLIALELLSLLNKHHLDQVVPDQIKLIGFDDAPFCKYACPPISSVRQDVPMIAQSAVENLLGLINHTTEIGKTIMIPVSLQVRASSR